MKEPLKASPAARPRLPAPPPGGVVARVLEAGSASEEKPPQMAWFCATLGISERSLRSAFHREVGMSPHRYLRMHGLHQVRQRLQNANPTDNVLRIAAHFGFRDGGRMARSYRALFDEYPSETLAIRIHQLGARVGR